MTKGIEIDTLATVVKTGIRLVWDIPYIEFKLVDGRRVRWTSEDAADAAYDIPQGAKVIIKALAYPDSLRDLFNLRRVVIVRKMPDGKMRYYASYSGIRILKKIKKMGVKMY